MNSETGTVNLGDGFDDVDKSVTLVQLQYNHFLGAQPTKVNKIHQPRESLVKLRKVIVAIVVLIHIPSKKLSPVSIKPNTKCRHKKGQILL